MGQSKVSYELAHKMFSYDPLDGTLTRKITISSRAMAGMQIAAVNTRGYITVRFEDKPQYAHRLIWLMQTGDWPTLDIDHINGIPGDNRWENLRHVSRSVNLQNKVTESGVYWAHRDKVWVACIQVNGKKMHIGQHKNKAVAEMMYKIRKAKLINQLDTQHPHGNILQYTPRQLLNIQQGH